MNKNYEKIKAACLKANPKLMELSFGCEVIMTINKYTSMPKTMKGLFCGIYSGQNNFAIVSKEDNTMRYLSDSEFEILGHEPTLQDILLATNAADCEEETVLNYYDLSKPVKDQSEETLQFIANLL